MALAIEPTIELTRQLGPYLVQRNNWPPQACHDVGRGWAHRCSNKQLNHLRLVADGSPYITTRRQHRRVPGSPHPVYSRQSLRVSVVG